MSVEQTDVVDIISTDRETGHVVLTISDHLDWSDSAGHQTILQKKLNTYLAFVESGEILEQYPKAKNRPVAFKVVFRVPPDDSGRAFIAKAREVIEIRWFHPPRRNFHWWPVQLNPPQTKNQHWPVINAYGDLYYSGSENSVLGRLVLVSPVTSNGSSPRT